MSVDREVASAYAEQVLGTGPFLSGLVREQIDMGAGTFEATAEFRLDAEGFWADVQEVAEQNLVADQTVEGGYRADYTMPVQKEVARLLSSNHVLVVGNSFKRVWPVPQLPERSTLRIVTRPVQEGHETYFIVEAPATQEDIELAVRHSWGASQAVGAVAGPSDHKLPDHGAVIAEEALRALTAPLRMAFMRMLSYDGYLIWHASASHE